MDREFTVQQAKAAKDKRASYACACFRSFIKARHQLDNDYLTHEQHTLAAVKEAQVKVAAKRQHKRASKLLRKEKDKLAKQKTKDVVRLCMDPTKQRIALFHLLIIFPEHLQTDQSTAHCMLHFCCRPVCGRHCSMTSASSNPNSSDSPTKTSLLV